MKKIIIVGIALLATISTIAQAYNFKDFDKVVFNNINGSVDIELGKDFSIVINGLPTNSNLVRVEKTLENKLVITLQKGLSWEVTKNINLKIKITMPEISKIYNSSNADVVITNFIGRYLGIENNGNGNVELYGKGVDEMDIENNGNGDCKTKAIEAKKVNISKKGNGNVVIKTNENFEVKMSGNGDVVNFGNGKATINSQTGNGKVVYRG